MTRYSYDAFTHTYRGRLTEHAAIGGESTGLGLMTTAGKLIELDLPQEIKRRFAEGKVVTIEGRFEHRTGVEIPTRRVFVVTKMIGI